METDEINILLPLAFALFVFVFFVIIGAAVAFLHWIGVFKLAASRHLLIVLKDAVLSFAGVFVIAAIASAIYFVLRLVKNLFL